MEDPCNVLTSFTIILYAAADVSSSSLTGGYIAPLTPLPRQAFPRPARSRRAQPGQLAPILVDDPRFLKWLGKFLWLPAILVVLADKALYPPFLAFLYVGPDMPRDLATRREVLLTSADRLGKICLTFFGLPPCHLPPAFPWLPWLLRLLCVPHSTIYKEMFT
jgi:hypothetical protein